MTLRIPAPETAQPCPKCGAENVGAKVYVWSVVDERGAHVECDCCAFAWKFRATPRDGQSLVRPRPVLVSALPRGGDSDPGQ